MASSSKCNGAYTRAEGLDLVAWKQFLISCLNDLFGLNNPVCVTRGVLFLLIFLFLAFYEGLPLIISFVLGYVAFLCIGGKEHTAVMARTLPRDLREMISFMALIVAFLTLQAVDTRKSH